MSFNLADFVTLFSARQDAGAPETMNGRHRRARCPVRALIRFSAKDYQLFEWLLLAQSGRSHKGGYGITTRGAKRPSTICDLVKCNLRVSVLQIQCCQMCVY
jgi:hypothetical protein